MANFEIVDNNIKKILEREFNSKAKALETCGLLAERYGKDDCPKDTGTLRNSITHKVEADDGDMIVGTNIEYAPYVEYGTGLYSVGGRKTPWVFKGSDGKFHVTLGSKPQPFIHQAISKHITEYERILKKELTI